MLTFIKIVFIVLAGIFLVSFLGSSDFSLVGTESEYPASDGLSDRAAYIPSYDTNDDGTISDREYERGELERIEAELADVRRDLAEELEERSSSPYADDVSLYDDNAEERSEDKEYLTVEVSSGAGDRILITGWKLKSIATGRIVSIPKGISPNNSSRSGRDTRSVSLKPGERAVIVSGDFTTRERFWDRTGTFVEGDWMVFLGSSSELWRNSSDAILLLDEQGRVVASVTY